MKITIGSRGFRFEIGLLPRVEWGYNEMTSGQFTCAYQGKYVPKNNKFNLIRLVE